MRRNLILYIVQLKGENGTNYYSLSSNAEVNILNILDSEYKKKRLNYILSTIKNKDQSAFLIGHNYINDTLDTLTVMSKKYEMDIYVLGNTEKDNDDTFLFSTINSIEKLMYKLKNYKHVHVLGGVKLFTSLINHCKHLISKVYLTEIYYSKDVKISNKTIDNFITESKQSKLSCAEVLCENQLFIPRFIFSCIECKHKHLFLNENRQLEYDILNSLHSKNNIVQKFKNIDYIIEIEHVQNMIYKLKMPISNHFNVLANDTGLLEMFFEQQINETADIIHIDDIIDAINNCDKETIYLAICNRYNDTINDCVIDKENLSGQKTIVKDDFVISFAKADNKLTLLLNVLKQVDMFHIQLYIFILTKMIIFLNNKYYENSISSIHIKIVFMELIIPYIPYSHNNNYINSVEKHLMYNLENGKIVITDNIEKSLKCLVNYK